MIIFLCIILDDDRLLTTKTIFGAFSKYLSWEQTNSKTSVSSSCINSVFNIVAYLPVLLIVLLYDLFDTPERFSLFKSYNLVGNNCISYSLNGDLLKGEGFLWRIFCISSLLMRHFMIGIDHCNVSKDSSLQLFPSLLDFS